MILFAFGCIGIGSLFIFIGFVRQAWLYRVPSNVYNAALCMAIGMDLAALGMILQLGGRIYEIMFEAKDFDTLSPVYWLGVVMLFAGKTFFVWVAAMGEGRKYSKPFIWSYWAFLAAWAAFVIWWHQ